ncbi:hypothetical protein CO731_04858 [Aminobacter sp. MSH1]|uniref:hypothetical protein n=1 Tax=Aminobacter sp. MSH1 TaxID=374606 RepID=UPI000D3EB473|nr:hypothetical protein [Aminobacter sp. MSH1]AWC25363.1 hypothetical protein CO731_04858 [Aminobacter sp. MSH1]
MGGSNKSPASASPAATPTPQQPMQTIQPAMPGQLEALAQQLGSGFGQQPADMMSYLQQFYKPMQMPDYSKGYVPPTGSTATPAASSSKRVDIKQPKTDVFVRRA